MSDNVVMVIYGTVIILGVTVIGNCLLGALQWEVNKRYSLEVY